ncbi:MAG: enoyl-CoA hydratase/isomerase family protein, partial [Betaproteobacteria bacterium]|nr:enoyl-CoA hydratase/isomerase family protein [Betaproteobacteria bacterium]
MAMSNLDTYRNNFEYIRMERQNGILQMSLHCDGGPMRWNLQLQAELAQAFTAVGADRENRIIILTGTGDEFSGPRSDPQNTVFSLSGFGPTAAELEPVWWNAKRLITRLLDIDVPMIAVVNGPAKRHSELALLCDIVIAADDATFEDTAHFELGGHVPGDGTNVIYTMLLGINRARYFMLTGQVLS